jgi:hypothetical protein
MPWGAHRGTPIDQLPASYLVWALANTDACDPDHARFWPELKQTFEALVGTQAVPARRPRVLSAEELCARLKARGITLVRSAQGRDLQPSGPLEDEDLREAWGIHKSRIMTIVFSVEPPEPPRARGSVKLLVAAEVRNLIRSWYGKMSRRFHPDAGGSAASQSAVNQSFRSLMEDFEKWEQAT